ncbi:tellurium resistance protein TerC [Chryseobacterium sp. H3056]|uniref:Tellurium resistance protein TerC n=1 Tax=Kaistella daneshvariae TaxID=2487074 RepID=A0A3N0WZJ7_9FLAO|nr:MauE/DoxX family redox-associated membrane protein [Kaistella daneshvariae]ROI10081.1 tellurium resistance protein TerC [Kaistella daneshvariae]
MYTLRLPFYISYFFALLFIYAAVSKMLDFENFQVQLAQSPLLSAYAGFISYGVLALELLTAGALLWNKTRRAALYASFGLMVAFTVYIYLILNYSDYIPCSCGGILEKMSWGQHLFFNSVCVVLAWSGIFFIEKGRAPGWSRTAAFTALTAVFSTGTIVALFLSSEYIIKKENNFTRRFLSHPLDDEDAKIDLGFNSYYFAGFDSAHVYLGNTTAPLVLTTIDAAMRTKSELKINLENTDYSFRNVQIKVKTPYYYLYDGDVPVIYRGKLPDLNARIISYNDAFFSRLVVIDSVNFGIRTMLSGHEMYSIGSLRLKGPARVHLNPDILQKQTDGLFDSDGKLVEDPKSGNILYTYFYRNQFLVMDSQLRMLRRLRTIDTISHAQVNAVVLSDGTRKMAAPPQQVNKNMTAISGVVFNQSNLRGKFEEKAAWKQASVIDCYRTDQQKYIGSFYISNRGKNKVAHLLATERYLYVISGNELVRYRFAQPIIREFQAGDAENL